jgi:phosphohistidine phosphatase
VKTLFLLRHADAVESAAGLEDADRVLSARGRREAAALPERIGRFAEVPTAALCSSARRAVETLDGWLSSRAANDVAVDTDPSLYLASGSRLVERLLEVDDSVDALLVIAHNPGIAILAHELLPRHDRGTAAERVRGGFPPAALAVFEFDVTDWSGIAPGRGRLLDASFPESE